VGFVDNPDERYSRLYTLTVEEYRARRIAQAAHEKVIVLSEPVPSAAGS
jgi:hypothetical protein